MLEKTFSQFIQEINEESSPDIFLNEETGEQYYVELDESNLLLERRIKIRISSKGVKTKRIICGPGRVLKTIEGRKVCVVQTGSQKAKKKLAIRKAIRTKRAKGPGYFRRINIKRQRAIKRRKAAGIKPGM